MSSDEPIAILFADICGSTALYENLGNDDAYALNRRSLDQMVEIVGQRRGTVIRTEGDAVLCTFPSAEDAFLAAQQMQDVHRGADLSIKVGFHVGQTIRGEDGDIYGDAVNHAAGISSLARAGETLLTQEAFDLLAPIHRGRLRLLDARTMKGHEGTVNVHTVVDDEDTTNRTVMTLSALVPDGRVVTGLALSYQGQEVVVDENRPKLNLGRGTDCDLVASGRFVSRLHATIEVKRDSFVLSDRSLYGTYVSVHGHEPVYLKRESTHLTGYGLISLGSELDIDPGSVIRYRRTHDLVPPDASGAGS